MIRLATKDDSLEIVKIYNYYISNTIITFEENVIQTDEMRARITSVLNSGLPWLVAEENGRIIGYAYATKWAERSAYKSSVESTVYLERSVTSKGWGSILYKELLKSLRDKKFRVVIGGISLPNIESVGLHEKLGFEKVAQFKEVGYKFNKWIDVGYWQVKLID